MDRTTIRVDGAVREELRPEETEMRVIGDETATALLRNDTRKFRRIDPKENNDDG